MQSGFCIITCIWSSRTQVCINLQTAALGQRPKKQEAVGVDARFHVVRCRPPPLPSSHHPLLALAFLAFGNPCLRGVGEPKAPKSQALDASFRARAGQSENVLGLDCQARWGLGMGFVGISGSGFRGLGFRVFRVYRV